MSSALWQELIWKRHEHIQKRKAADFWGDWSILSGVKGAREYKLLDTMKHNKVLKSKYKKQQQLCKTLNNRFVDLNDKIDKSIDIEKQPISTQAVLLAMKEINKLSSNNILASGQQVTKNSRAEDKILLYKQRIQEYINIVDDLQKKQKVLSERDAEGLLHQIKKIDQKNWTSNNMKGALAELLAKKLIDDALPVLETYLTGEWLHRENKRGDQIIQDVIAVLEGKKNNINIKNKLDTIVLTADVPQDIYNLLQKGNDALLRTQVKSGEKQSLLNKGKNLKITLNDLGMGEEGHWYKFLVNIYSEHHRKKYYQKYFRKSYETKTISAYANYALNKNVHKTALANNDIYFTSKGFMTFQGWAESNNYALKLRERVRSFVTHDLSVERTYNLYSLNRTDV